MVSSLFLLGRIKMTDYGGGDNPLLIYIAVGAITLILLSLLFFFLKQKADFIQFHLKCRKAKLNSEEVALLKNLLHRFHLNEYLNYVTSAAAFNSLATRAAHQVQWSNVTEAEFLHKSQLFGNIREKLGFSLPDAKEKFYTSRQLPCKHPLHVVITDDSLENPVSFSSKVIANSDLMLSIQPPSAEIAKLLPSKKLFPLSVSFQLGRDGNYGFKSAYIRTVDTPLTCWCIKHADELESEVSQVSLKLRSTLTVADDEGEVTEIPGLLTDLTNRQCVFATTLGHPDLDNGAGVVLSFNTDDSGLTLRAAVETRTELPSAKSYRLSFTGLSADEEKRLARFAHQQKKTQPAN